MSRASRHAGVGIAVSVAGWVAAVGAAAWLLRRAQPAELRALPLTHPDSIGLPLVAFALLLAGVLATAHVAIAAARAWRRRRPAADSSSPPPSDDAS